MAPTPTSWTTTASTTSHSHCPPIDNSHGERGDRRWPASSESASTPILALGGVWRHTPPPLPVVTAFFFLNVTRVAKVYTGGGAVAYWVVCIPAHAALQRANDEDQDDGGYSPGTTLRIAAASPLRPPNTTPDDIPRYPTHVKCATEPVPFLHGSISHLTSSTPVIPASHRRPLPPPHKLDCYDEHGVGFAQILAADRDASTKHKREDHHPLTRLILIHPLRRSSRRYPASPAPAPRLPLPPPSDHDPRSMPHQRTTSTPSPLHAASPSTPFFDFQDDISSRAPPTAAAADADAVMEVALVDHDAGGVGSLASLCRAHLAAAANRSICIGMGWRGRNRI
ncbi:hypothetical protein R3P38DRAFT_3450823 [Favolaschia claudopus]|uniref:Uncharacterized protein n=1 Tax=Favolaschia claudopus TaxID=2862362 RepID=A0AAV9ZL39_9AGAR